MAVRCTPVGLYIISEDNVTFFFLLFFFTEFCIQMNEKFVIEVDKLCDHITFALNLVSIGLVNQATHH